MFKKSQSGRSMLEMLGVLAIIGILSALGLVGYSTAIAHYRASEIIKQTNTIALDALEQLVKNMDINIGSWIPQGADGLVIAGYDASLEENEDVEAFEIIIEDVPQSVCEKVMNAGWSEPYAIFVNGVVSGPCAESNSIAAAFDRRFKTCSGYLSTSNGCVDDTCPKDQYYNSTSGTCRPCTSLSTSSFNSLTAGNMYNDSCTKCSGFVVAAYSNGNGIGCLYCPSPRVPCGRTCCPEGQVCLDATPGTCGTAQCTTDEDCTSPSKPLCNTLTRQCVAGCHTNSECGEGEYCRLRATMGANNCYRIPDTGACEATGASSFGSYKRSGSYAFWYGIQEFCSALGSYRPATYYDICGSHNVGAHTLTAENCPNFASIPNFEQDVWLGDPRPTSCHAYKLKSGSHETALHYVGTTRFVLCVPN